MNVLEVPLDKLTSNPWQTRQAGDQAYIKELALDIAANGLLQIPVGRALNSDGAPAALWGEDNQARLLDLEHRTVQLAFGHNRLAAYRWLAAVGPSSNIEGDWTTMPVEIRTLDDEQMAALAWSENEKRRDHTPIERARAIQARIEHFRWTHEEAAERLGISRSVVTNTLRLLKLPEQLQEDLQEGVISERQGLALIALYDIDEAGAHSHDFEFTRQVIIGWAREGWSSEKIRDRVNDALKMLREQIQPELTAPQREIEQAPVQTGSLEHEPPAAREIEAEAEPRRGENQREDPESAEINPDDEPEGEKPRNAVAKTPQTAPPPTQSAPSAPPQTSDRPSLSYDESTLVLTITLMPVTNGVRPAIIGLRANNGTPVMRMTNEEAIYTAYSDVLLEMFAEIKEKLDNGRI